jgi:hypothetical protein
MKYIVKNTITNEISEQDIPQAFIDQLLEVGQDYNGFIKATQEEVNSFNQSKLDADLEMAKKTKKALIEANYKQSKQKCQILYQNQSYSRNNGFDSMLQLCLQWKSSSQTTIPSINIPISLCAVIYDALLLLRDKIANNIEICKIDIDSKDNISDVEKFTTNLKILFDAEIRIEDLL